MRRGFRIKKDLEGNWYFQRADGRPISERPAFLVDVSAETNLVGVDGVGGLNVSAETSLGGWEVWESVVGYG